MNKKKLRGIKLQAFIIGIIFVWGGILLIYRNYIPESKLKRIDDEVISTKILKTENNFRPKKHVNYSIVIQLKKQIQLYGIYSGTEQQAQLKRNELVHLLYNFKNNKNGYNKIYQC